MIQSNEYSYKGWNICDCVVNDKFVFYIHHPRKQSKIYKFDHFKEAVAKIDELDGGAYDAKASQ